MKIGMIAGSGNFPLYVAANNKDIFVLCVNQHSSCDMFKNKTTRISLTNPENWILKLKKNNITHVVLVGKINRPRNINKFSSKVAKEIINKISDVGDNSALNIIETFFNKNGIKLLPIHCILKECFVQKGFYSNKYAISNFKKYVLESSRFGVDLLNKISEFDVGQSVVVSANLVYAIEGQEGTNSMIGRAASLFSNHKNINKFGPVLIKVPKKGQNQNLDLPVIGIDTIKKCIKLGFSAIVISSTGTLIVDLKKVMMHIKKHNFCILSI